MTDPRDVGAAVARLNNLRSWPWRSWPWGRVLENRDAMAIAVVCDALAEARQQVHELRAALKQFRTVVRPWIDGGATFHEWRVAVDSIDAALARYPEGDEKGRV